MIHFTDMAYSGLHICLDKEKAHRTARRQYSDTSIFIRQTIVGNGVSLVHYSEALSILEN